MKAAELRDLGADELGAKERDLTDQLFRLRLQKYVSPFSRVRRSDSSFI